MPLSSCKWQNTFQRTFAAMKNMHAICTAATKSVRTGVLTGKKLCFIRNLSPTHTHTGILHYAVGAQIGALCTCLFQLSQVYSSGRICMCTWHARHSHF